MSRSSIPLWKRVFKNVATPGLPECPPDLNEPRYADLVFNKSCTVRVLVEKEEPPKSFFVSSAAGSLRSSILLGTCVSKLAIRV